MFPGGPIEGFGQMAGRSGSQDEDLGIILTQLLSAFIGYSELVGIIYVFLLENNNSIEFLGQEGCQSTWLNDWSTDYKSICRSNVGGSKVV